jgi:pimeloyl-ACP methyl ester carboxylesterase
MGAVRLTDAPVDNREPACSITLLRTPMSAQSIRKAAFFKGHHTHCIVGMAKTRQASTACLHGGPGVPHDYLRSLDGVTESGRRVIYYDQLGCGESATPSRPETWTVDLYLNEVSVVREALAKRGAVLAAAVVEERP